MISVQQPFTAGSAIDNQGRGEAMFYAENRTTLPGRMGSELPMTNKQSAMGSPLSYTSNTLPVGSPSNFSNADFNVYQNEMYNPAMPPLDVGDNNDMWAPNYQPAPQQSPYCYPMSTYNHSYPYDRYGMADMTNSSHRKNATRESTNTLKAWLQEHKKNPYPTKGEKIMLAIISKMTLTQVSTWFANARRRLKKENKMTWVPKNRSNEAGSEKKDEEDNDGEDDVFLQTPNKEQSNRSHYDVTPSPQPNTPPNNNQKIWSPLNESRSPTFHNPNSMNITPLQNQNQTPKPTIYSNTFPTLQSSIANSPTAFRFPKNNSFYNDQNTFSSTPNSVPHSEAFSPAFDAHRAYGKYQTHSNQRVSSYTIPSTQQNTSPCQDQSLFHPTEAQLYSSAHPQCNTSPNIAQPCYDSRQPDQVIYPQQTTLPDDCKAQYYSSCSRESSPQNNCLTVSNPNTLSPWNCGQTNDLNNRTLSELSVH